MTTIHQTAFNGGTETLAHKKAAQSMSGDSLNNNCYSSTEIESASFLSGTSIKQTTDFTHTSLAKIAERAASPRIGSKETAPWFCPHDGLDKTKRGAEAATFHAVILDLDSGGWTRERLLAKLGCGFIAWTSSSHMQTKGSDPAAPRWKVLIPISPAHPQDWLKLAKGACIDFDADQAQARLQQVAFLPNKLADNAPYEFISALDRETLPAHTASEWIEIAEGAGLAEAAARLPARKEQPTQAANIIRLANEAYNTRSLLESSGYIRAGAKRYLSPHSTSGIAGVTVLDDGRMYSHGSTDPLGDGMAHDAFDLLVAFRFDGDATRAIRELANELDPQGQAQRQAAHAAAKGLPAAPAPKARGEPWGEYEPILEQTASLPYPIESLPPLLRNAVDEVHSYMQAPLAMIATSAIAVASACVQARLDVRRDSVLKSPTSLFALIVAESGERKTAVDSLFMKPIHDFDRENRKRSLVNERKFEAALAEWKTRNEELEAELSKRKKSCEEALEGAEKALEDGEALEDAEKALEDGEALEDAEKALDESVLNRPHPPRVPSILLDDTTPEAVIQTLVFGHPVGFLSTSEGGSFFGGHGMNPEAITRNLAVLNARWDGARSKVSRSNKKTLEVDGVRLAACVMVQPAVLKNAFEKAGDTLRGSGFLARFLICWPNSTQGTRLYKTPGAMPALEQLNTRMKKLLDNPAPIKRWAVCPFELNLSPAGFELWREIYNGIEMQLAASGNYSDIRDSASKAADNVARIAAVFHDVENRMGSIEPDLIRGAAEIVLWHLSEAQRLYADMNLSEQMLMAAQLEGWLVRQLQPYPVRDILNHAPSRKLRKKAARDAVLDILANVNRCRVRGGVVDIHPELLAQGGRT